LRAVTGAQSVGDGQPSLRLESTLVAGRERLDVALETVPDRRPVWEPTFERGALPAARPGLLIARSAADALDVGVGDRVRVVHPVPTGPQTFRLETTTLPVTGIHTSPLRFLAYTNTAGAAALGVPGLVNRISVVPAAGSSAEDVKAELLPLPGIAGVQGAAATTDAVDEVLKEFDEILAVTVAIAAAMALLIAFNATAINADERTREHATMFAHGVPVGRVMLGAIAEALLIGALGTAVGVVAGHAVLSWVLTTTVPETMPDLGIVSAVTPATYGVAVVSGIVVVAAAPLLTLGRLRRTDLSGSLRVVE
ncbi:MAG: FtsX-like permease family protein, partial [Baekduiaceae bacterium]